MRSNAKQERILNQYYAENFDSDQLAEKFEYLKNKTRGKTVSDYRLTIYIRDNRVGTMIMRYDPILFQTSKSDF